MSRTKPTYRILSLSTGAPADGANALLAGWHWAAALVVPLVCSAVAGAAQLTNPAGAQVILSTTDYPSATQQSKSDATVVGFVTPDDGGILSNASGATLLLGPLPLVASTVIEGEGNAEGVTEGAGEGLPEGIVEGNPDGEGLAEGVSEGAADGEGIADGEGAIEGEGVSDGEGGVSVHTADQNSDNAINLSELLRVIQFYNSATFGCESGTEDGFAPNDADRECPPHVSDYDPQDWIIVLSELLRLIQLYNLGSYSACVGSEDGFCAGR